MDWQEVSKVELLESARFILPLCKHHNFQVAVIGHKLLDVRNFVLEGSRDDGFVPELRWQLSRVISDQINHNWFVHAFLGDVLDEWWDCC